MVKPDHNGMYYKATRITKDQLKHAVESAKKKGGNYSEYIRRLIEKDMEESKGGE